MPLSRRILKKICYIHIKKYYVAIKRMRKIFMIWNDLQHMLLYKKTKVQK